MEGVSASPGRRPQALDGVAFALPLLLALGAGRAAGGYTQASWGAVLVTCGIVGLAAVSGGAAPALGRLELVALTCLAGLAGWTALSLAWTSSLDLSADAAERAVVPVAVLATGLLVARVERAWAIPTGVLAAAVVLAFEGLVRGVDPPLGYANALGSTCIAGIVLAVGLAGRARTAPALAGAAAAVLLFAIVVERAGTRGAWPALAGGAAVALSLRLRRPAAAACAALAVAAAVVIAAGAYGSEPRQAYWRATVHTIEDHPLAGTGAGTWRIAWLERRDVDLVAQNAHSLYLETLAELGPVGLGLLLGALLVPLAAAASARGNQAVPWVTAAYAALLLHLAIDWQWQITPVAAVVVLIAAALLAAAREGATTLLVVPRQLVAGVAVAAIVAGTAVWVQGSL